MFLHKLNHMKFTLLTFGHNSWSTKSNYIIQKKMNRMVDGFLQLEEIAVKEIDRCTKSF